ncbi:Metallo-dependent phosphatase-like protein [Sporodiniella umbellata]|nr:Metallo-dependent phosphatase-like protein [Sporodiniella umbellata]
MKLSWASYFYLSISVLSLFRAFQLYFQSTQDLRTANPQYRWSSKRQNVNSTQTITKPSFLGSPLGNSTDKILYFIQISDLHISKFQPKGHTLHFLHFLKDFLPTIKPEFVIVTGDLIDAKDKDRIVSSQYLEEWQVYKYAVEQGGMGIPWYDMRGNHDCFDLIDWEARNNFYKGFGKSADLLDAGQGVYSWQVKKSFGEYNFVVADACPRKGPSRPFNFFGYFTSDTMNRLASAILTKNYNHTFLQFSHYPTTTLFSGKSDGGHTFTDLANNFSMYLCGHLHKLTAGLGDTLKSYNVATDSLELELSDMKDHGSYRIVAIDHDLISFVDVDMPISQVLPAEYEDEIVPLTKDNKIIWPATYIRQEPIILITNPKDHKYILPSKEPLDVIKRSSHIRFLVFSKHEQTRLIVKIFIDGVLHPFPHNYIGSNETIPLWTSQWEPNDFDDFETHKIRIEVTAPDGKKGYSEISFRMDSSRLEIGGGFGGWIISISISNMLRFLCIFAVFSMVVALLVPKIYTDYEKRNLENQLYTLQNRLLLYVHEIDCGIYQSIYASVQKAAYIWIHQFLMFPQVQPRVWLFCFLFLLALVDLPWFYAKFIPSGQGDEGMGYFYLWGLYFNDQRWIPLDTWLFAIFELTFTVGAVILYFIWKSSDRYLFECKGLHEEKQRYRTFLPNRLWFQVLAVFYLLWRSSGLLELAQWYGGLWPVIVMNVLTWWVFAVFVILLVGKNGIISSIRPKHSGAEIIRPCLEICQSCSRQQ